MSDTSKREIIKVIIGFILACLCLIATIILVPKHGTKVYDCSIAEISPDYPIEVKNECRRIRANYI
jgi:ATP/ADP translocase